jgi:hypothetical protein
MVRYMATVECEDCADNRIKVLSTIEMQVYVDLDRRLFLDS